jgi:hypothetical protein
MLIASKAQILGKAKIYIDGVDMTTVDLYNPSLLNKQVVYSNLALNNGNHSIQIVVTGEKNIDATNTFVNIDAIDVIF